MDPIERRRKYREILWEREMRRHELAEDRGDLLAKAVLESRTRGVLSPVQLWREKLGGAR